MRGFLAALAVIALLAAPSAADAKRCSKHGAHTILRTKTVRVFSVTARDETARYYGCLYRRGRVVYLGKVPVEGPDGIYEILAAGRFLAFQIYEELGSHLTFTTLYRADLRDGRVRTLEGFGVNPFGGTWVVDVVLARTGATAWIRGENDGGADNVNSVRKYDAAGPGVLDPGPGVELGSLAITASGSRVYWTNAGEPRSAPLR